MTLIRPQRPVPTRFIWITAARKAALEADIAPHLVIGADTGRKAVQARWSAWEAMYGDGSRYSINGIAKVTGFDHTTILNAKRRGWKASEVRGNRTNFSRPHSAEDGRFVAALDV